VLEFKGEAVIVPGGASDKARTCAPLLYACDGTKVVVSVMVMCRLEKPV